MQRPFASLTIPVVWMLAFVACGERALDGTQESADASPGVDAPTEDTATNNDVLGGEASLPVATETVPVPSGVASWVLPRGDVTGDRRRAFLLPWPNDLARTPSGKVDLTVLPGADGTTLLAEYVRRFNDRLEGFSTVGAVYFRFGAVLDPTTLPRNPEASRRMASSLQLVDVDPRSPERGRRVPVQWSFRAEPTRWWRSNTLAVMPATGFPLRPATRYALVVTRDVRGEGGAALTRDGDLDAVLGTDPIGDPVILAARERYAPVLTELARVGIPREGILTMTVFTTGDPTREFFRAVDWVHRAGPMPVLLDHTMPTYNGFFRVTGHYGPNLVFQSGDVPYGTPGSGRFVLDATGTPQVQRMENVRFSLTIPAGKMPPRGWPLAIYAHGTGGDHATFIMDNTAAAAADEGVAMLGFDQLFHGERAPMGTNPDTAFFNFLNPEAGRTNNLQAALDLVQLGRFVRTLSIPIRHTNGERYTARFDPERIFVFGHSQGGLNAPLWLAADDGARAGVLSGAGGAFNVALLTKLRPVNVPQIITTILQLAPRELDAWHPAITLLQLLIDPSDPVNYGRYILREPREGLRPKHVFQTQGFVDNFTAIESMAALARAIGLPMVEPVLYPDALFPLTGVGATTLPARNNLVAAGGSLVTAAWMQFNAPMGRDGHFVVFSVPGARLRAARFLGTAGSDPMGVPTVPATVP
jgi:predicted esterase